MKTPRRLIVVRFRKDRQRWEVDAIMPPGSIPARTRTLYDTEEAAQLAAAALVERLTREDPVVDQNITLEQAFDRYFALKSRKKSIEEDERIAGHLKTAFGPATRLRDITASRIAQYKARRLAANSERRKDENGKARPLGAASINRPLALLRHLLKLAALHWEVIPKVPLIELEREPQGRLRWLAEDEEVRLLAACKASGDPDLLDTVTVAMESGLRQGELFDLTWDRVDLSRGKILLEVTKSGKRREVPMRQKVYDILAAKTERTGRVWPKGFNRDAWKRAVEQAKLTAPLTWHDLRHSFASWFMMTGGQLEALREILGHRDSKMTLRYAHLSPTHLSDEMQKTERRGTKTGTKAPQSSARDAEVVDSSRIRRGSSVVEQLIRNQ